MTYEFNKDVSTEKWDVKIDTTANYGYFERKSDGEGGGLWFGNDCDTGAPALIDYDGVSCLPKSIVKALRDAGYFLDSSYD
jgi:hypothetical protein